MARVVLERVRKLYGEVIAVDDVDLTIAEGEFLVLVGPSGCGKSTCLRLIAGLEEATSGTITIGDRVVNDVPPQDRDIAMVFQNYALYPHMTVYDNLAFGLRLRRRPSGKTFPRTERRYDEGEIRRRVDETAKLLELTDLLRRKPRQLSGGQRQRVALGRAIVREPQVFLMDEPLSNLDAKLRVQTRAELTLLHRRMAEEGKSNTTVYVTHDQTEAMTMGSRIAVMLAGVLQQVATPLDLYRKPVNRFVAQFIGSPQMNVIGPLSVEVAGDECAVVGPELRLPLAGEQAAAARPAAGRAVLVGIRPEDIGGPETGGDGRTAPLPVRVKVRELLGATVHLGLVGPGGIELTALLDADSPAWREERFEARLELAKAHLFDAATDQAIF